MRDGLSTSDVCSDAGDICLCLLQRDTWLTPRVCEKDGLIRALRKPHRDADTYAGGEWWLEPEPPAPLRRSYVKRHPLLTALGLGAAGCAAWLVRESMTPAAGPAVIVDRYPELP